MKNSVDQPNKCKILMVSLLLIFTVGISFAQNEKKDSLDSQIEKTKTIHNTSEKKKKNFVRKSEIVSKDNKKKSTRNSAKNNGLENGFLFKRYSIKNI